MEQCFGCRKEFVDNDSIKVLDGKFYHSECHTSKIEKIAKRQYRCPKCDGSGVVENKIESRSDFDIKSKIVHCDICKGHGMTSVKYKPVLHVVGYKPKKK